MGEEPFILLSLKEDKAKELSKVISNDTSRKILDYLSKVKDATETDISVKINVPISTIHYNISQLIKANLIEADEFHYSKKGKEVNHYKLANKLIIITPKETKGFKEKLKSLLPLGIIVLGASFVINFFMKTSVMQGTNLKSADAVAQRAVSEVAVFNAPAAVNVESFSHEPNIALWFLAGCVFSIGIFLLIEYFSKRRQ